MKRILITGAAGFIGFHLALFLKKRGDFVIGLDNFNSYYDSILKEKRNNILHSQGISIIRGDINDTKKIKNILQKEKITHCVHLAAQAGVRNSHKRIQDYINSNLTGFISLLEALKNFPSIKTIYASSSSVYGSNEKIPFSPYDNTDNPTNLYGATKKANELIAHAYHHLYHIPLIGLRYFTVYGPWGRPDMAYFLFTRNILNDKPIEIFNFGKMKRDFTYIDDIIQGTVNALDSDCTYDIFNLGNNQTIPLNDLVTELENILNKQAIKKFVPMQREEVLETYADITKSKEKLHFFPKISLKEGISRFVHWYREYYKTIS